MLRKIKMIVKLQIPTKSISCIDWNRKFELTLVLKPVLNKVLLYLSATEANN